MSGPARRRRARSRPGRAGSRRRPARPLAEATDLVGYGPYLDRVPLRAGQVRHASDNRVEIDRARHALAARSRRALASLWCRAAIPASSPWPRPCCEAIEGGDPAWRALDVARRARRHRDAWRRRRGSARRWAMISARSRCRTISSPGPLIDRRLERRRPAISCIALLQSRLEGEAPPDLRCLRRAARASSTRMTPVAFARAVGRPDERIDAHDSGRCRPRPAPT